MTNRPAFPAMSRQPAGHRRPGASRVPARQVRIGDFLALDQPGVTGHDRGDSAPAGEQRWRGDRLPAPTETGILIAATHGDRAGIGRISLVVLCAGAPDRRRCGVPATIESGPPRWGPRSRTPRCARCLRMTRRLLLWVARDVRLAISGRAEQGYYPIEFKGLAGWIATGAIATTSDDSGVPGDPGNLIADARVDLLAEADAASPVLGRDSSRRRSSSDGRARQQLCSGRVSGPDGVGARRIIARDRRRRDRAIPTITPKRS